MTQAGISIIAAVAKNGAIGRRGELLYHISDDLRRFKKITMGHPMIMGRKTFESFPNGPLPGRRNIVVTRDKAYRREGIEVANSLEEAFKAAEGADEAMVIGGGEIYSQAITVASKLYLTIIEASPEDADAFFPEINAREWEKIEESSPIRDDKSALTYRFVCLSRR